MNTLNKRCVMNCGPTQCDTRTAAQRMAECEDCLVVGPLFVCPECQSSQLLVYAEQAFLLNTMEFYGHSVKPQDTLAKVACCECGWCGTRGAVVVATPTSSVDAKLAQARKQLQQRKRKPIAKHATQTRK